MNALDFVEYEKVGHTLEDIKIKNIEVKELEHLSQVRSPTKIINKRGFINVGGKILKELFGIATEEDVHQVRMQVKAVVDEQLKLKHVVSPIITSMVNQNTFLHKIHFTLINLTQTMQLTGDAFI